MTELQEKLSRLSPEKRHLLALRLALDSNGVKTADAPQASILVDPANRRQPFPLTDLQQAYWIGRGGAFDIDVASHSYLELEGVSLDLDRMNQAWQRVIDRHEMLRAIIHPHGEQQVLDESPRYEIAVSDLRGKDSSTVASKLDELRNELSHQVLDADRWPLFDIRAGQLDGGRVRIFVSLDALFIDGWSIHLLLTEWSRFYSEPEWSPESITLSFRDWVLAENEATKSEAFKQARAYWQQRVPSLPPAPSLPLACNPATLKKARFVRQIRELPAEQWQQLKTRAAQAGLTPTGVLVSAYAEVLSLWSGSRRFTINLPSFNRPPLHPESNKLVAEIASFTLLEIDNSGEESFKSRAKRHQEQLWQDLSHGAFGGVKVLREIAQTQSRYSEALMPVIFTSLPENTRISELPGLGNIIYRINQTSQVWLDNHVTEHDGVLHIDWDSVEGLLPAGMPEDMLDAYMRLLESLADEEQTWQQTWTSLTQQLVPAAQLARRKELNSIEASLPDCLLTDLFAEQVVQRPEQQAVVAADCSLSYTKLHQLSLCWGRKLRECGVEPNHLVAVVMEKGWEQVVAILGIHQAGGAYLPIDASEPQQRLSHLLENSGAEIVLTQSRIDQRFEWPDGVKRFAVDREDLKQYEATPIDRAQGPDDLAYVLYTSGSTGQPKGVMISQRGAVNCVLRTNQRFDLGPDARALGLTALHHDMSVYDIFGILSVGGTLIVPEEARRRDPAHWLELVRREGVTFWCSVPATMEMLLEYATAHPHGLPESLRLVFLGGDWIPVSLPQRLKAAFPAAKLVSVGGPTETTMWNIWYPVEKADPNWKTIPYGKPIANNKYYVLNEALGDCPDWVSGEQYVGGVQLARGYWRDEQKTAERFITHPRTGERLYRTGDRGRYLPDGNIEFLGRADFQVKINGQRIELGEIESALSEHPAVKTAIVGVAGRDSTKKRLVGYVVPKNGNAPAAEELATFLRGKLPEHMVPTAFVTLECLPLTANGKVERQRLPEPGGPVEAVAGPAAKSAALSGPKTTAVIAGMVADVLGIPSPEAQANLLTLGANSLDMVRLGNSLEKKFGLRPRMDQLFRMQTVAALAEYYDEHLGQKMSAQAVGPRADDDVAAMIASYEVMIDPSAREKFKESMPGVRRDNGEESTALRQPPLTEELLNEYRNRRTARQFSLKAVPLDALSEWLSCLRPTTIAGKRKYLYASPGGLYPTQVYLHCKPGRVESLDAGVYYYNPVEHKLVLLTPRVEIDRGIHIPFINTPVFDEAGFSVFLICEFAALAPSYGERSMHFATMEAGILTHLLETHAHAHEIALCSIGTIDFDRIRPWFRLGKSQVLIHSMVGGRSNAESTEPAAKPWDRVSTLEDRIKKLSPEEVTALLKAHKRGAIKR